MAEHDDIAAYAENLGIAYSEAYIGSKAEQDAMHELARLAPHLVSRIRELEATVARVQAELDSPVTIREQDSDDVQVVLIDDLRTALKGTS